MVFYVKHHAYFFWQWVTNVEYLMVCDRCNNGFQIAEEVASKLYGKETIPSLQRHAWIYSSIAAGLLLMGYSLGRS